VRNESRQVERLRGMKCFSGGLRHTSIFKNTQTLSFEMIFAVLDV